LYRDYHLGIASIVLLAALCSCGDDKTGSPLTPEPEDVKRAALVGVWLTQGDDPDLGTQVDVQLKLQASGELRVTVTQSGGASLSFPGTWALIDDVLQLRGVWFQPDGEVDVACSVDADVLILTSADGGTQRWERGPAGTSSTG
jgi:hypothetical protein